MLLFHALILLILIKLSTIDDDLRTLLVKGARALLKRSKSVSQSSVAEVKEYKQNLRCGGATAGAGGRN